MTRWSKQFEDNAIHETLKSINNWLNVTVKEVDADHEAERRRLKKTVSTISEVVGGLDPEMFPEKELNHLHQHLRHDPTWANLEAYANDPTIQALRQANDHITSIIPNIFQLGALSRQPKAREVIKAAEEASDAFCSLLEKRDQESILRINEQLEKLNSLDLGATILTDAQTTLEQNIGTLQATWQGEHTVAQTERAEAHSKAQIERATNFDAWLREWRTMSEAEVKKLNAKHAQKLQAAFDKYESAADSRANDMKAKHEAILEIHGLVGTDGVAGGYQKGALDEHDAANLWRRISMGAVLAAAIWILVKYYSGFDLTPKGEVNWYEVVTAASLTLLLLGAAGYAARQSKLHRETEQHMKWFALEVKAIDPFLSSLPVDHQSELKKQLTQKLFGQNHLTADKDQASLDPVAFKSIMDTFHKFAGKG